ncbi:hypothetical protein Droror1_Dr00009108 [Drosera rotundifolia]
MPPETTTDRRPTITTTATSMAATATKSHHMGIPPPADQDPLPCPRCDSTNTKFCYYNNYNFSQPRHFCKSCRRYWTRGGTLRDIPVGGGSRKTAKRPRSFSHTFCSSPNTTTSSSSSTCFGSFSSSPAAVSSALDPIPSTPLFVSLSGAGGGPFGDVLLKPATGLAAAAGGFTSLLGHAAGPAGGFLSLGGFGLGLGLESSGLEELGLGRNVWAFPELGYLGGDGGLGGQAATAAGVAAGGDGHRGNTWQMESGGAENGFLGGGGSEYFSSPAWPELAISTPGNGIK